MNTLQIHNPHRLHHKLVVLLGQMFGRTLRIQEQRINVVDVVLGDVISPVDLAGLECWR